jgi:hypothetical protein
MLEILSSTLLVYNWDAQFEEDNMGSACNTVGEKNAYRGLFPKPEKNMRLGRTGSKWRIILKWIIESRMDWYELDSSFSKQGPVEGSC